jgi:S1-C subfamily serine protease
LGDVASIGICHHRDMSHNALLDYSNALADAADAIAPSVVQVHGRRRPASGIVFAKDVVLTTTRALGRDDGLNVRTPDNRTVAAEAAGWDPATGLVVLRAAGLDVAPAAVATGPIRVGHLALAVARSWSNAITVTHGVVSVIGGPLPTGPGRAIDRVIRTTAPMHGGFAGGAFVDVTGRVLGVTTAAEIRGLGVVIPADIAWAKAAALVEHGTVKRGYLGLAGQSVLVPGREAGIGDRSRALLIVDVVPGGPADTAGLLVGDVLIEFDGQPVASPVDLLERLEGRTVGQSLPLTIVRGGARATVTVTIGERPSSRA